MHPNAQKHPFEPIFDERSKVLILGSFPPKNTSQKDGFYYADSSNRFWSILGTLFDTPNLADKSKDEKIAFLKKERIALYDIWGFCSKKDENSASDDDIVADESQKADLSEILQRTKIQKIFTTIGGSENSKDKRGGHFKKWGVESWLWDNYAKFMPHCKAASEMVTPLYSTSNASSRAGINNEILLDDYKQIKESISNLKGQTMNKTNPQVGDLVAKIAFALILVAGVIGWLLSVTHMGKDECFTSKDKSTCQKLIDKGLPSVNECNDGESCRMIGFAYDYAENYEQAFAYYEKACSLNYGRGCFNAGAMYFSGKGAKQDDTKAMQYYQKACDLKDGGACSALADMYERENVKDYAKAIQYYEKACELKDGKGCFEVGIRHQEGTGVKQDKVKAKKYFGKACEAGYFKGL